MEEIEHELTIGLKILPAQKPHERCERTNLPNSHRKMKICSKNQSARGISVFLASPPWHLVELFEPPLPPREADRVGKGGTLAPSNLAAHHRCSTDEKHANMPASFLLFYQWLRGRLRTSSLSLPRPSKWDGAFVCLQECKTSCGSTSNVGLDIRSHSSAQACSGNKGGGSCRACLRDWCNWRTPLDSARGLFGVHFRIHVLGVIVQPR